MVVQSHHTLFFFPKLIFPNKEEASNFTQLKFSLHIFGYKHVYLSPNYFIIKLSFSRGSLLNTFSRPFSSSLEKKFLPETRRSRKFVLSLSLPFWKWFSSRNCILCSYFNLQFSIFAFGLFSFNQTHVFIYIIYCFSSNCTVCSLTCTFW